MIHDTQLPILLQHYCIASILEPRLSIKSDHASLIMDFAVTCIKQFKKGGLSWPKEEGRAPWRIISG